MAIRGKKTFLLFALAATLLAVIAAGCGGDEEAAPPAEPAPAEEPPPAEPPAQELSGSVEADGSSTVGPFTTAAAELFQEEHPGVVVTVGISGTGGGFERFCVGETDISNASRPIADDEIAICQENGIDFIELHAVNDGLSVVVNPENDWATCLTVEELNTIWAPESEGEITSWAQVRDGFPDEPLVLAGAGTDSGTFDYFTDAINGEEGASRADYTASEDDNVTVQAVSGEVGGLGYFGLSYLLENEGTIKGVEVDGGNGCVAPSSETVQDATYTPLGRSLFLYAKVESFQRPEVQEFMKFAIDRNQEIADLSLFVPLTDEQKAAASESIETAIAEVSG